MQEYFLKEKTMQQQFFFFERKLCNNIVICDYLKWEKESV